jgi:glycine hydroxymethyltransferase
MNIQNLITQEEKRQKDSITLIPSENYATKAVRSALASTLSNKYSEGYPKKRYYPGNQICDDIEEIAQENTRKAFGISDEWSVNVQPYSGSPANLAAIMGLIAPGETIMGLALADGGHLTHGHPVSATGMLFKSIQYHCEKKSGRIDYEELERLANTHKPRLIISGTTAYPRAIDFARIHAISTSIGCYHLADISHIAGLIAHNLHPTPFPYADVVVSTTHKMLRGPRGAVIISKKTIASHIDRAVFPGLQGGPHNATIAAIAITMQQVQTKKFARYAKQIIANSMTLADCLKKEGFTITTNGTDTHLMVLDMRPHNQTGTQAEQLLEKNNILANRNSLPDDTKPFSPNGLRIGTPAITARGMKGKEMELLATLIRNIVIEKKDMRKKVAQLCNKFPVPKD